MQPEGLRQVSLAQAFSLEDQSVSYPGRCPGLRCPTPSGSKTRPDTIDSTACSVPAPFDHFSAVPALTAVSARAVLQLPDGLVLLQNRLAQRTNREHVLHPRTLGEVSGIVRLAALVTRSEEHPPHVLAHSGVVGAERAIVNRPGGRPRP